MHSDQWFHTRATGASDWWGRGKEGVARMADGWDWFLSAKVGGVVVSQGGWGGRFEVR